MNISLQTRHSLPSILGSSLSKLFKPTNWLAAFAVSGMVAANAAVLNSDEIKIGPGEILSTDLPGGGSGIVVVTNTLSISPNGILNLKDNALIVRTGNFATILGYVATGFSAGPTGYWDGPGINSSTAAADPFRLSGVGIIDNSEAHLPTFEGHSTPLNTEILVKYALYGDANLDGFVNNLDVALMGTGTGIGWYHGDFNYSGTVDAADYALLNAALPEPVPEPGSVFLLLAGAAVVGSRRERSA